jgi:hypothetical protein
MERESQRPWIEIQTRISKGTPKGATRRRPSLFAAREAVGGGQKPITRPTKYLLYRDLRPIVKEAGSRSVLRMRKIRTNDGSAP